MEIIQVHIVPENAQKMRLSDYAFTVCGFQQTKSGVKKLIQRGEVLVNGDIGQTATWVAPGDQLSFLAPQNTIPAAFDLKLDILYEDDDIAVINKPAGIPVSGNQHRTIQNALLSNLSVNNEPGGLRIPRPAHRLDALTCGLLLIGKTSQALMELNKAFEEQSIHKTYFTLVQGKVETDGRIDLLIDGKEAETHYHVLECVPSLKCDFISLLELTPRTGRTHQLRKHMAAIGHPILGDGLYTENKPLLKGKGLYLASIGLEFEHPISQKCMKFSLGLPSKFERRLRYEQQRWDKFN